MMIPNPRYKLFFLSLLANGFVFAYLISMDTKVFSSPSSQPAQALSSGSATYTVSKDGKGNYSTIQACADVAKPGDTCKVLAGVYDERVQPIDSGLGGRPITFAASGKVKVRGFRLDTKNYITVNGFEITSQGLTSDLFAGIFLESSNFITLANNTIHDTVSECIGMRNQFAANLSNGNIIKGNTISHCGAAKATGPGPGISIFGHNNLIEGNDISHLGESFIRVSGGEKNAIRNNILHDNSFEDGVGGNANHIEGIFIECAAAAPVATSHLLIDGNQQYNTPSRDTHFVNYENTGTCGSSNFIVRNNTVKNMGSSAILGDKNVKTAIYANSFTGVFQDTELTHVAMVDGGRGETVIVDDAGYFQDGWAGISPDYISVGTKDTIVQIKSVNYSGNVLTLDSSFDRTPGDNIWFYKNTGQAIPVRKKSAGTFFSNDTTPPSTPGSVQANVILVDEVNLVWIDSTDNVGITGYTIYRDGMPVGTSRSATFRDTSVESHTIYMYAVTALDAAGNESYLSSAFRVITPSRTSGDKTPPKQGPQQTPALRTPAPVPSNPVVQAPIVYTPIVYTQPASTPAYTPAYSPAETPAYRPPSNSGRPVSVPSDPKPLLDLSATTTDDTPFEFQNYSSLDNFKQFLSDYVTNFRKKMGEAVKLLGR